MNITTKDYSALSDDAYKDRIPTEQTENQKPVPLKGIEYTVLKRSNNPISGFQGTVYLREDTADIVVSMRGTEMGGSTRVQPSDIAVDAQMGIKRANAQLHDAEELTKWAINKAKEFEQDPQNHGKHYTVSTTGHSLGGGMAEYTAHKFGLYGESFNSFGANGLGSGVTKGGHFTSHVMAGDVVSAVSQHYGKVITYAKPGEISIMQQSSTFEAASSLVTGSHAMSNFTGSNGQASVLDNPDAIQLAQANQATIDQYRNQLHTTKNLAVIGLNTTTLSMGTLLEEGKDLYGNIQQQLNSSTTVVSPQSIAADKAMGEHIDTIRGQKQIKSEYDAEQRIKNGYTPDGSKIDVMYAGAVPAYEAAEGIKNSHIYSINHHTNRLELTQFGKENSYQITQMDLKTGFTTGIGYFDGKGRMVDYGGEFIDNKGHVHSKQQETHAKTEQTHKVQSVTDTLTHARDTKAHSDKEERYHGTNEYTQKPYSGSPDKYSPQSEADIKPITMEVKNDAVTLSPNVTSLHKQLTEKFEGQLSNMSDKDRATIIALSTQDAVHQKAKTVDYVFINDHGKVLIGFDNNMGYSNSVNVHDAPHHSANQVLTAAIGLEQEQANQLQARLSQEQTQSIAAPVMKHSLSQPA